MSRRSFFSPPAGENFVLFSFVLFSFVLFMHFFCGKPAFVCNKSFFVCGKSLFVCGKYSASSVPEPPRRLPFWYKSIISLFVLQTTARRNPPLGVRGEYVSDSYSYSISVVTLFVTGDVTALSHCDAGVTIFALQSQPHAEIPLGGKGESVSGSISVSFSYSFSGVTHETVCNVSASVS